MKIGTNYVIGCGGGGSWTVAKLAKVTKDICLVDGDTLEEKNLDRQLFDADRVGENKAEALAKKYLLNHDWDRAALRSAAIPEYFSLGLGLPLQPHDILWCCADNHACRREVLAACDQYDCRAVIAANEEVDFEAYWYEPSWFGTLNDPRVIYTAILTDRSGDPLGPPGCVEHARQVNQLVFANDAASSMACWLWWFHTRERLTMDRDTQEFWPIHHRGNSMRMRTILFGDRQKEADAQRKEML